MPTCRVCHFYKESALFPKNSTYKSGRATICLVCSAKRSSEDRKKNPLKRKAAKFRTTEAVLQVLFSSTEVCQICGEEDRRGLCIDHNHETGKIRGLLCDNCNKGIGLLREDSYILEKAKRYLEKYAP